MHIKHMNECPSLHQDIQALDILYDAQRQFVERGVETQNRNWPDAAAYFTKDNTASLERAHEFIDKTLVDEST